MNVGRLAQRIDGELDRPVPEAARLLAAAVLRRFPRGVCAILFHGSCLRRFTDEGLLDLYVLVDRYRSVHRSRLAALLNALLPPNVFALRVEARGREYRAKCSVVSLGDFRRHVSPARFHPYFWARFAQPCALLHADSETTREQVVDALAEAVRTTVARALPLVPPRFAPEDLWVAVLSESYRTELRPERPEAVRALVAADRARYAALTLFALEELGCPWRREADGTVTVDLPRRSRTLGRWSWPLRRAVGKSLALLRLVKGAFTFENGLEYAMWKIQRHSGAEIDPRWRERRPRWLAALRELWRLYRHGAVR